MSDCTADIDQCLGAKHVQNHWIERDNVLARNMCYIVSQNFIEISLYGRCWTMIFEFFVWKHHIKLCLSHSNVFGHVLWLNFGQCLQCVVQGYYSDDHSLWCFTYFCNFLYSSLLIQYKESFPSMSHITAFTLRQSTSAPVGEPDLYPWVCKLREQKPRFAQVIRHRRLISTGQVPQVSKCRYLSQIQVMWVPIDICTNKQWKQTFHYNVITLSTLLFFDCFNGRTSHEQVDIMSIVIVALHGLINIMHDGVLTYRKILASCFYRS